MNKIIDTYLTLRGVLKRGFIKDFEKKNFDYIENFKISRLRLILKNAQKEIPYYRNLFWNYDFNPDNFNSLDKLNLLPVLNKKDVLKNYWNFISCFRLKNAIKHHTSGTTGEIFTSFTNYEQWIIEQGAIWNQWKKANYHFRDKICILRSFEGTKKKFFKLDKIKNWLYVSPNYLNERNVNLLVNYLNNWKVKFLRGYPSSISILANYLNFTKRKIESLRGILLASEVLSDKVRLELTNTFKVPVFNHYGQAETTCMFHQLYSDDDTLYNLEYYGHAELVKTSKKNIYNLVATNLWNNVMPLVRYDTGDTVLKVLNNKKNSFLRIKNIIGRQCQYLFNNKKDKIPTTLFYTFFSKIENLEKFQIIQNSYNSVVIILKFEKKTNIDVKIKKIKDYLNEIFRCKLEIKISENFILSSEGKFNPVIQKIKNE